MGRALIDRVGQRFGRLVVVSRAPSLRERNGSLSTRWLCRCECGAAHVARAAALTKGDTRSCGCLNREVARAAALALHARRTA